MNDKSGNKTSEFMDKQIMDLSSSSPPSADFIHPINGEDHQLIAGDNGLQEIVPSYDFQPIRLASTVGLAGSTASRVCSASVPLNKPLPTLSSIKGFGSLDSIEPTQLVPDKGHNLLGSTLLSQIDTTMKRHADILLHVMDGVTARLTHLETRTHNLEHLVNDLKVSLDKCHHGNMTQIQNILVEVQSGVQLLKDKHEIFEAQLQLSKLQVSKEDQHPKTHSLHVDPTAQSPAPLTPQQFPLTSFPQTPSSAAALSLHPPSSHQSLQPPSTPFSPQQEPYCPPPSHSQPPPPNQLPYQAPPQTQPPYQSPPQQPQYPQQPPPPSGYIPEEHPSYAPQSYSPDPPRQQPQAGSSFPSGYLPESYPYTGLPMVSAKPPPHMSGSGANYPRLSNSRPLPMAAAVSSGSSSPRSESRVPIDDVIDRVTTMGFPRDQVRATVRKLTENGQAVDLNVVLDKLMNEGEGAWFGGP